MKLLPACALASALVAAPAGGAKDLDLVELAPALRLEAERPPAPGRRYAAREPAWRGFVLPGQTLRLLVAPVASSATLAVELGGERWEPEGRVPLVAEQSAGMVPSGRVERVAELLVPPGTKGLPGEHRALPARLVEIALPDAAAPGRWSGRLLVDGEPRALLEIELLEPLPEAPSDPALAFLRGRFAADGRVDWPELTDEDRLLRDLRRLRRAGATHATWYGDPSVDEGGLERVRRLWREAGFETEPVLIGWWPGPLGTITDEQAVEAVERVRALRRHEEAGPRLFWVMDEPIRAELLLARKKARLVREGGGLSTASVQVETAHALRHDLDLPMIDNYLAEPEVLAEAVRSVRAAGSLPWGYWQSFGESARFSRWNAGFRQLGEATRGQAFYAYAHVLGSPWDDLDGEYRDMLMVQPHEGELFDTLQLVGLEQGLRDLALARGAEALVRLCRLQGLEARAVERLEERVERARRRWSAARARWGRYSWDDVARPGRDGRPRAAALERTRQDILEAVAAVQALRRESPP